MIRKKKNEFAQEGDAGGEETKSTTCPAEIRLRTEFAELDLPALCKVDFPDKAS